MIKKCLCASICFIFSTFSFSQSTRRLELTTEPTYMPTGKTPEVVVQENHSGAVVFVKYSSDGKYIFSASTTEIKIWETESGLLIKTKYFPSSTMSNVDFSPDGSTCVFMDNDKRLVRWDVFADKESVIDSFDIPVSGISFSPNGSYLAVGVNTQINVYNTKTFKKEFSLYDSSLKDYRKIVFSSDSKYIVGIASSSAITDKRDNAHIVCWEINSKKLITHSVAESAFTAIAISSDNEYLACANKGNILITERNTKQTIREIKIGKHIYDLKFMEDSEYLLSVSSGTQLWNFKSGAQVYNTKSIQEEYVTISPNNQYIAVGDFNKINIRSADKGKLIRTINGPGEISHTVYNNKYNQLFTYKTGGKLSNITVFDKNLTKQTPYPYLQDTQTIANLLILEEGILFTKLENKIRNLYLYSFATKEVELILDDVSVDESTSFTMIASSDAKILGLINKEGSTVYFLNRENEQRSYAELPFKASGQTTNKDFITSKNNFAVIKASTENKAIIFNQKDMSIKNVTDGKRIHFSADEKYCAIQHSDYNIHIYDTSTWEKKAIIENGFDAWFSPNGKYIAVYSGHKVRIYDFPSLKELKTISDVSVDDIFFNSDSTKIIMRTYGKIIRTYSVATGSLLASTIADENGDWLTYTPEGYFTGSPGGINKFVHLVDGMQVFELGQMYDTLYRPDLVQAKLEGKDIGKPVLKDIVATGDAPRVQFVGNPLATSRVVTLEFSVQDTGGGIGYVYLSHNGKAIQVSAGEESKTGQRYVYTCNVTLAQGENVFEAYAANCANKIESRHVSTSLTWRGRVEKGSLYVLAMGVDKYEKMPQNNLQYSVADATAIVKSFTSAPGGLYQSVNVMSLLDGDVNKANIQKAFDTFATMVKPDDMFVLHIAGHGVNYDGEYYFLPADTYAKTEADFATYGVSKHFLTENLSKIAALNTLVLLDTCYSGAFIDAKAKGNELAQKTALEHLAHTSGQAILTASANSQTAGEGYKGHGVFTYAILQALGGKANYNADGTISIKEVMQYIAIAVPDMYAEMGLPRQSPWNSPLHGDFYVVASGNKAPSQWTTVSLVGGKRADFVTVRIDDTMGALTQESKSSAMAKSTATSLQNDMVFYGGLGYFKGDFYDGLNVEFSAYFSLWKYLYAGFSVEGAGTGIDDEHKDSMEDNDIFFIDALAHVGAFLRYQKIRTYVVGALGAYASFLDKKPDDVEEDAPMGFTMQGKLGIDYLCTDQFSIGAFYTLKYFAGAGYVDNFGVSLGMTRGKK